MSSRATDSQVLENRNISTPIDDATTVLSSSNSTYKSYKYRFVITILYFISSGVNAIMWICTSPITTSLQDIYQLSIFTVNFCTSLIWFVTYPPVNFIANYILDEKGLRTGIFVGTGLTVIGLWIRVLSQQSFYYIFAGQLIGSIGQPFLLNAPQKLSAIWYPPKDQALSTTISSIANPVGVGVGFLMAQIFVDNGATGLVGLTQVYNLMLFTAILGTVLAVPIFFFFKAKPPIPPSRTADTEKYDYVKSLKNLFANQNYLIFITSVGLIYGAFNVLATALQPMIKPYGFSESEAGNLGAITLISGLIGSIVWGIYIDRKQKYKLSIVICGIISVVCLFIIAIASYLESFVFIAFATVLYGFFTTPILPVGFELSSHLSFPVAEAASGGLMIVMIQIIGFAATFGVDALLNDPSTGNSYICLGIVAAVSALGIVGFLFTKEDLRKNNAESKINPEENIELTNNNLYNNLVRKDNPDSPENAFEAKNSEVEKAT